MECWYKEFHLAERYLYGKLDIASWRLFSLTKEGRTELLNERLSNQLKNFERKLKEEASKDKTELTEEQLEKQLTRNLSHTFSCRDKQEYTILYWARQASNLDSRKSMLHCFYDFLKKHFKGEDLVYWAIPYCQPLEEIQHLLFAAGSSPVLSPYKLLEWAVEAGNEEFLEYLFKENPRLGEEGISAIELEEDPLHRNTALHAALERSNFGIQNGKMNNRIIIETLLTKHPPLLHQKNSQGFTPLFSAIKKGLSLEVTHCLILNYENRGLKFDDLDEYQETLVHAAVRNQPFFFWHLKEDLTIIKILLSKAPQLLHQKNKYGFTPIFLAIQLDSVEIVELFLSIETVSEYHFDNNRNNPLHAAVYHWGSPRPNSFIIELLLRNKPELLCQKNADGMTPLILAIEKGQEEIVHFFLRRAQDEKVFAPDDAGNTPLHAALLYPNKLDTRIIHQLIKKNSKLLNQKNAMGMSPASLAMSTKSPEVTEYFSAQSPANVNGMACEIQATIEFLYKKACTVRVREKTGIEILPSLECSFATEEDAQVVSDELNKYFCSSAPPSPNWPVLLLSIGTCHDMLQQAKEDMGKRYEELELLLNSIHPAIKERVKTCMSKHLGVDFNIQIRD